MAKRLPPPADVLKVLEAEDRPLHAKELASKLDVDEASYEGFLRLLDNLAFDGILSARDGHRFKLARRGPAAGGGERGERGGGRRGKEVRLGVVTINPRGFGFVASVGAVGDDVFIPREALSGAMHGDKVEVEIVGRGARGAEGVISKIVERSVKRIAGVLRRKPGSAWVEPDDTRMRGPIVLTSDIDRAGTGGNSGKDGDAVIVTITRWPAFPDENPEGKIEVVLGTPGELRVEIQKILLVEGIDEMHGPVAFAEAEAYGPTVPKVMLEGREDLTHLPLPTIDPEDARDHDDAVWVERTAHGGYTAWIAIADVSSYVRPGTALDEESKKRGCSVYLPDRAIPMLPRPLSSNLCSLLPHGIRLCLCVEAELDASGTLQRSRLIRGFMKSRAKLTYGGVARALRFTDAPAKEPEAEKMVEDLRVANELSRLLRSKRMKRGALDFDLPEAKIILDPGGAPIDVERRAKDPGVKKAYQLIEELMLLGNEVVAKTLSDKKVDTVFRIHEAPDETKLEKLGAMCEQLGVPFDMEDAREPKKLAALVRRFNEHPLAGVLNMLLLRAMKQATYDVNNLGHFGLASPAYLHFTSPIRRYPDLVVHRTVHALVQGEKIDRSAEAREKLEEAALAASVAERKAMEVERAVADLYRAKLMSDRIGERYEGTVSAIVGSGAFVTLDAPFVDVLLRVEDIGAEGYEVDDDGLRIVGVRSGDTIALGDRLVVEIVDASLVRRVVFARRVLADSEEDAAAKRAQRAGRTARGGRGPAGAPRPHGPGGGAGRSSGGGHARGPGGGREREGREGRDAKSGGGPERRTGGPAATSRRTPLGKSTRGGRDVPGRDKPPSRSGPTKGRKGAKKGRKRR